MGTLAAPGSSAIARSRTDATDQELVQAVRAGDDRAFERLYHRYHRRIASYLLGMVRDHGRAEDLTQEVFVSALRRMRQTERPIAFKPWIYEIAKNASIDAFRRAKRTEEVSYDADDGLGAADQVKLAALGSTPDAALGTKESLDHLWGAFGGLSDAHHQILVLRELEGLSYQEIGERLGMSRPSVESTLFRARRRLTEEYEELVTGERCLRIQGIIAGAVGGGALGLRDTRRVGSHIFHCQPCRRQAVLAGLDTAVLARRPVRGKLAALLPLPGFLRRRWLPGGSGDAAAQAAVGGGHGASLAQVSMAAAQYGEPTMSGWMKGAALATAVAVAGVGTGAVEHGGAGARRDAGAAVQQRSVAAAGGAGAAAGAAAAAGASGASAASGGARRAAGGRRLRASAGTSTRHSTVRSGGLSTGAGGPGGSTTPTGGATGGGTTSGPASGSSPGGSSGAASPSGSSAAVKPQGSTGGTSGSTGTGSGQQVATGAGSAGGAATGGGDEAAGGSVAGGGAAGSTPPLIQPDLSHLTQPPADASPPTSVGDAVSDATDAVGGTVGGQVGGVVQDTGEALGDTVDHVTDGVGAVLGGLLGHKK